MEVSTTTHENCDVIKVTGKLDHSSHYMLDDAFRGLYEADRYKIVLDLNGVDFMSSSGLRILADGRATCRRNEGDLALVGLQERVYETLDIAGFVDHFSIFDDIQAAIDGF